MLLIFRSHFQTVFFCNTLIKAFIVHCMLSLSEKRVHRKMCKEMQYNDYRVPPRTDYTPSVQSLCINLFCAFFSELPVVEKYM